MSSIEKLLASLVEILGKISTNNDTNLKEANILDRVQVNIKGQKEDGLYDKLSDKKSTEKCSHCQTRDETKSNYKIVVNIEVDNPPVKKQDKPESSSPCKPLTKSTRVTPGSSKHTQPANSRATSNFETNASCIEIVIKEESIGIDSNDINEEGNFTFDGDLESTPGLSSGRKSLAPKNQKTPEPWNYCEVQAERSDYNGSDNTSNENFPFAVENALPEPEKFLDPMKMEEINTFFNRAQNGSLNFATSVVHAKPGEVYIFNKDNNKSRQMEMRALGEVDGFVWRSNGVRQGTNMYIAYHVGVKDSNVTKFKRVIYFHDYLPYALIHYRGIFEQSELKVAKKGRARSSLTKGAKVLDTIEWCTAELQEPYDEEIMLDPDVQETAELYYPEADIDNIVEEQEYDNEMEIDLPELAQEVSESPWDLGASGIALPEPEVFPNWLQTKDYLRLFERAKRKKNNELDLKFNPKSGQVYLFDRGSETTSRQILKSLAESSDLAWFSNGTKTMKYFRIAYSVVLKNGKKTDLKRRVFMHNTLPFALVHFKVEKNSIGPQIYEEDFQ